MLLRGTGFIETNAGAGIGWACCDYERQDLTRPIVAYIWITPDSVEGATPPAPYFQSVSPGSGGIDVELRCSEAVDGFELSHSTIALPDLDLIQYSQSGDFHVTTEVQQYLFGRTVRTGKRSDWTPYGTSPPGYSPWETVWNDSFSHYTGHTAYPGLSHVWGTGGDYVYVRFASPNRVCCHDFYNPQSLSIFGTSTGVLGSYWGARHQFKAYFNWYGTSDENAEELGVVFGARVAILTSYLTETYYVLAGRRKNATELYFRLYSVTGSTFTQLDISGNVHSYFPLLTTPYDIQITRTGDDFYVHKISTGEEVWHTTDDSIPPATTRIYTGVWMTGPIPLGSGGTPYIWDYWKIYRMVSGLDPAVVDPGHPYDGLQPPSFLSTGAGLSEEFALSKYVLQETGNDNADYVQYTLGNLPDRQPKVKAKAYDPATQTWSDTGSRDLRLSTDIVAADYGGTGADLSGGGAVGDILIADDATTFKRLAGNTAATQKFLAQTGTGAASADPTWETVDLSDYVTTAGLTAGAIPKASDTHALADSLITESGAVVSIEGDLTLNADTTGENRTLTIKGYDTGASAVKSLTATITTTGFPYFAWAGQRFFHSSFSSTNLFVGYQAGNTTLTGSGSEATQNTGVGYQALQNLTTGAANLAFGYQALASCSTGTYNCAFGSQSLYTCGAGIGNTGFGWASLYRLTDGDYNVAIGQHSGFNLAGASYNTLAGYASGFGLTSGGYNTCLGGYAGSALTTVDRCTFIGHENAKNVTGTDNTAIGWASLYDAGGGTYHTAIGSLAGRYNTGTQGTFLGYGAGYTSTGNGMVCLGYKAGYYETAANKLFIDNASRTNEADARAKALIYGIFAATTAGQSLYFNSNVWVSDVLDTNGRILNTVTKTADYTATVNDDVIVANKATAITITLPAATGSGRRFIVKSIGVGACTIDGDGADTIDGAATAVLTQWDAAQLIDYASNAWIIV